MSEKILITRLSHIGDCLLTLPLVNAIREQRPNAQISWAVESPSHQLLSLHPGIQSLINIPRGWLGKPSTWNSIRRQLRKEKFDVVIDPQGISKSSMLGWLSGASIRVGIKGRWGREISPWLNNRLVETESPHIVERSIELISALGLKPTFSPPRFDLPVCPESASDVSDWLNQSSKQGDFDPNRIVVINPGGTWASKRWEMPRYGELAAYLKQKWDLTSVIVWAGAEEKQMAEEIHQAAIQSHGRNACVVAMPTTLRQLAAIESMSKFFIGGDTGPLHLASAVGTRCIGLYGTTRPSESGAYGAHHIAIQAWYQDGTCRERRNAANDAMRDISVEDVANACDQMVMSIAENNEYHQDVA